MSARTSDPSYAAYHTDECEATKAREDGMQNWPTACNCKGRQGSSKELLNPVAERIRDHAKYGRFGDYNDVALSGAQEIDRLQGLLSRAVELIANPVPPLRPAAETECCPGHYKVVARNVCTKWPHCLCTPEARAAEAIEARPGERAGGLALKANEHRADCVIHRARGVCNCGVSAAKLAAESEDEGPLKGATGHEKN